MNADVQYFNEEGEAKAMPEMTYSELEARTRAEIEKNQSFSNVKKDFGFTKCDEILTLLMYYSNLLLALLPRKGKDYVQSIFENIDENILAQWVEVIYKPKSDDELEELLKDAKFYECITDLQIYNVEASFKAFYEILRNDFKELFLTCQNLSGILEIYQCCLKSTLISPPNNSTLLFDAVKVLWNKCNFENAILNLEANKNDEILPEHRRLAGLVSNFEGTTFKTICELIKDLFKPTVISRVETGIIKTLKIEGYKVILSTVYDKIVEDPDVKYVQIIADNELFIDQNLILPGISVSCASNSVTISESVEINLSGKNDDESMKIKAEDGKEPGECGADGKHGKAGNSSGNFVLIAENINGTENLKLTLNGSNGDFGQNGGDGANGKDSVGVKFNDVFDMKHRIFKGVKKIVNLASGSLYSRTFDKKIEKINKDGILEEIHIDSPYYFSTHTFEMIKGPDGGKGGLGGKRGLGGQGGYRGSCKIEIKNMSDIDKIKIEASDGKNGPDGHPGKNGDYGMEGWDIALIDCTLGKRYAFGETENQKLEFKYTSTKEPGTIYVSSEYKGEGSQCYVKVEQRPCVKRLLADSEKYTEFKDETERSGESIAVEAVAIDIEALKRDRKKTFDSFKNTEKEIQITTQEIQNIQRIYELYTDEDEKPYIFKKRHEDPKFPSDEMKNINLNDAQNSEKFWKATLEFSLEKLLKKYSGSVQENLKKKHALFKLRSMKSDIDTPSFEQPNLITKDEVKKTNENYQKYSNIFHTVVNLKIDEKSIEFHLHDIERAFYDINPEAIATIMNKMAMKDFENAFQNPLFDVFKNAYEALPDEIKETNCRPLFYFLKLYENLLINNIFFRLFNDDEMLINDVEAMVILHQQRTNQAIQFQEKLENLEITHNFESGIINFDCSMEEKISLLFDIIGSPEISAYLQKEFEFICKNFEPVGITFLNSLLYVFEIEGCYIDVVTLKYLIDTVFNACKIFGSINCYIFPSILLITKQHQWIDQFFMFNAESALKRHLKDKPRFLNALEQIEDENLKILCTEKLYESETNFVSAEELLILLETMKERNDFYPQIKNIDLKAWIEKMKQITSSQNVKSEKWLKLGETSKKYVLFWCTMICEHFNYTNVEDLHDKLIELSCLDIDVGGRFFQRLCDGKNVVHKTDKPLKDILQAALKCLESPAYLNNDTECYKLCKELLAPCPDNATSISDRKLDEIKYLCQNINDPDIFNTTVKDVLYSLSTPHTSNITQAINSCVQYMTTYNSTEEHQSLPLFKIFLMKFECEYENCRYEIDKNQFLLKIIDEIIHEKRNFKLRDTQKIAILSVLKDNDRLKNNNKMEDCVERNVNKKGGMLQQIATGEGKTLIIAAVSIISALKGRKINIVTTTSVLAKRDASDSPHGCQDLYHAFGLKVDHICYDCPQRRQEIYTHCHIIYGDLTSYQRDYLLDKFYSAKIALSRGFDIMIVDEVDSLLLDNGLNTLYLSHNIADFEMLHSLIIHIWNLVNIHIKNGGNCKTETFLESVYTMIFPVISLKDFTNFFNITDEEAENFKNVLLENKFIDETGKILITSRQKMVEKLENLQENIEKFSSYFFTVYSTTPKNEGLNLNAEKLSEICKTTETEAQNFFNMLHKYNIFCENDRVPSTEMPLIKQKFEELKKYFEFLNSHFLCIYDKIMECLIVNIPEHMKCYVSMHLKEFIENAQTAFNMEANVHYRIGVTKCFNEITEPKIIITDCDTGMDLPTTQWHKGLHQFLQLKHGLRLTALSTKAVFISNILFLRKFCIYGFSGTLGAEAEKKQLNDFYQLKSVIIPSSNVKQFYEEPTIIKSTKDNYYKAIFESVKEKMEQGRSVLVIGNSAKHVDQLYKNVKQMAQKYLTKEEIIPFINALVYKQDSEDFEYGKGTALGQKAIIFATNLVGRGTDIRLTELLKKHGGLHVIIAFLPKNIRIEEQAFGRAARSGERGTAQLIICDETLKNESMANIFELKWKRNATEAKRIAKIQERYENNLKVEEECLEPFEKKFEEFEKLFKTQQENKFLKILQKDMLDRWAIFLDESEYLYKGKTKRIKAAEDFCSKLSVNVTDEPKQPLNMLSFAVTKINEKKYDDALILLEAVNQQYPTYSPESQYYTVFITVKRKDEGKQLEETKNILYKARYGFTKRLSDYAEHLDIIEKHKVIEENRLIKCDTFMQQQKESTFLIKSVINSIDVFFGQIITPDAFVTDKICEEASMFLFDRFSNPSLYECGAPLSKFIIKKDINERNLKNYCKSNGLCFSNIEVSLKYLHQHQNVDVSILQKEFEIPTWQNFWDELVENNLLTDFENHIFVDTSRMPKLTATKINEFLKEISTKEGRTFKHLYVTKEEWKELDSEKVKDEIEEKFPELYNLLKKNKIICETKSGILTLVETSNPNFKNFSSITKNTLMQYDILEEEANAILKMLTDNNILQKDGAGKYKLIASINSNTNIVSISWYDNIVMKMIKQKLTFTMAFQMLQNNANDDLLHLFGGIPNFVEINENFVTELIDNEIIERTNINLHGLRKIEKEANLVREKWEWLWETEAYFNVLEALDAAQAFIDQTFGEQEIKFATLQGKIFSNPNANKIVKIFENNAAINEKFSKFDISLIPIKERYLDAVDNSYLMITHGLTHLIEFRQMKWTKQSLIKSTAVTVAGLAQLAGGIVVISTGVGALAGKMIAFEGLSDIIFGVRGFYSGNCDTYWKHKVLSMGLNATACSVTEAIKFTKDATFFKAMLSKMDVGANTAINFTKQAIPAAFASLIFQIHSLKNKYDISQEATESAVSEVLSQTKFILDNIFDSNVDGLRLFIKPLLQKFDIDENNIKRDLFKNFIKLPLEEICYFMLAELRTSIIENKEITEENNFLTRIINIKKSSAFKKLSENLSQKLQECMNQFKQILRNKLNAFGVDNNIFDAHADEIETKAKDFLQKWKNEIEDETQNILKDNLKIPCEYKNEAEYQKQLDSIVISAYCQLQKHIDLDFNFTSDEVVKVKDDLSMELFKELKTNYFMNLEDLQNLIRQPIIYAATVNESLKIDAYGANALSQLIYDKLQINAIIFNENNGFINSGESMLIIIKQNFDDNSRHIQKNVYQQILEEMPQLENHLESEKDFINALAANIACDTNFFTRYTEICGSISDLSV